MACSPEGLYGRHLQDDGMMCHLHSRHRDAVVLAAVANGFVPRIGRVEIIGGADKAMMPVYSARRFHGSCREN